LKTTLEPQLKENEDTSHRPQINAFSKEIVENMRKSYGLTQIKNKWEERKQK